MNPRIDVVIPVRDVDDYLGDALESVAVQREVEFGSVVVNSVGTGGAATKVSAARLAAASGVGVLVTSAELVDDALNGRDVGTWFDPNPEPGDAVTTGAVHTSV